MSQNPNKRNKDTKEVAEENIDQQIDNEDSAGGEEVAGQRDERVIAIEIYIIMTFLKTIRIILISYTDYIIGRKIRNLSARYLSNVYTKK